MNGKCPTCGKATPTIDKFAVTGIRCSLCVREGRAEK